MSDIYTRNWLDEEYAPFDELMSYTPGILSGESDSYKEMLTRQDKFDQRQERVDLQLGDLSIMMKSLLVELREDRQDRKKKEEIEEQEKLKTQTRINNLENKQDESEKRLENLDQAQNKSEQDIKELKEKIEHLEIQRSRKTIAPRKMPNFVIVPPPNKNQPSKRKREENEDDKTTEEPKKKQRRSTKIKTKIKTKTKTKTKKTDSLGKRRSKGMCHAINESGKHKGRWCPWKAQSESKYCGSHSKIYH